jgi:hypothetical protein
MSSTQNQPPQNNDSATSAKVQPDAQEITSGQVPSAETHMDQYSDSSLSMTSSASPLPSDSVPSSPQPDTVKAVSPSLEDAVANSMTTDMQTESRQQPIPPASEPMQYRAIGLIRGVYCPSDEQFTRGVMQTQDGIEINAVLLGRVMSLVKKHIDLEKPHLWVVYPRTRSKVDELHVQIVGVWEPENLNRISLPTDAETAEDEADPEDLEETVEDSEDLYEDETDTEDQEETDDTEADLEEQEETAEIEAELSETETAEDSEETVVSPEAELEETPVKPELTESATSAAEPPTATESASQPDLLPSSAEPDDNYFSIRGEIIFYSQEQEQLLVKIQQAPRRPTEPPKSFKVALKGTLEGKALGYFWDLHVRREETTLVVQEGNMIAPVPPKKRGKRPPRRGGGKPPFNRRRPGGAPYRRQDGDRPNGGSQTPQPRREAPSKPIKRPKDGSA